MATTPSLHRLYDSIFACLEAELRRAGYLGPVAIDAFVYRTPEGGCRLKPVVEINPRYTMGGWPSVGNLPSRVLTNPT